jgi:hypothetical protein
MKGMEVKCKRGGKKLELGNSDKNLTKTKKK